jgi:hypothetical protein
MYWLKLTVKNNQTDPWPWVSWPGRVGVEWPPSLRYICKVHNYLQQETVEKIQHLCVNWCHQKMIMNMELVFFKQRTEEENFWRIEFIYIIIIIIIIIISLIRDGRLILLMLCVFVVVVFVLVSKRTRTIELEIILTNDMEDNQAITVHFWFVVVDKLQNQCNWK